MKYLKNILIISIILSVLSCTNLTNRNAKKFDSISTKIDSFKIDSNEVEVLFYDPALNAKLVFPELSSTTKSEKEKKDLWDKYLHCHTVYLFKVKIDGTDKILYYVVRGDENISKDTDFFYKVEVVENWRKDTFDPNNDHYANNLKHLYRNTLIRGSIFDQMELIKPLIKEGKVKPGDGVKFFGYFVRISSYEETKYILLQLIEDDLQKKAISSGISSARKKIMPISVNKEPKIHFNIVVNCC